MSQERVDALMAEGERLAQLEQIIAQRRSVISAAIRETHGAIEAVRAAGGDALMPVGAGVFVRARLDMQSPLVVSVGSGVSVEKTKDSALLHLEERSKELVAAANESTGQLGQIRQLLDKTRADLEALVSKMQAGDNV